MKTEKLLLGRRDLLAMGTRLVAGSCLPEVAGAQDGGVDPERGVTAPEDLMKEHGVLDRCLLVYEAAVARLEEGREPDPGTFLATARLIARFVHGYHERNEEQYVFPELVKAHKLTDLVAVLVGQHQAGRRITAEILELSQAAHLGSPGGRARLATACQQFIRMYRPHAAREDTVVFPALRTILTPHQVEALGDRLERAERRVLGEGGFERSVDEVARLEKHLGIYDLRRFTP